MAAMGPKTRGLAALLVLALAGCVARSWDPHAPKTVTASQEGGALTVNHGARLRIPLANDPAGEYEWRRVEPQILKVVAEGPPDAEGQSFTPVRSGEEKLTLEYRPVSGQGAAQRAVSYDITVPERGIFGRMWDAIVQPFWRRSEK
jgi:predicted secreted protein